MLKKKGKGLNINSYGLNVSTMDDVFDKILVENEELCSAKVSYFSRI